MLAASNGVGMVGREKQKSSLKINKSFVNHLPKLGEMVLGQDIYTPLSCYCCQDCFLAKFADVSFW
jgi:hypothetical protein